MATVSTDTNLTAVSYTAGETIIITDGAVLTIDSTPSVRTGSIICTTSGKLKLSNISTTTPIVLTLDTNTNDLRFEKNGILEARGNMIELGTGDGTSGQAFSLASSPLDIIPYPSYVEVEDSVGAGTYTPYMVCAVDGFTINHSASEFSSLDCGKVFFWNGITRSLYVGDGTNGNVLTSGVKVRIPNICIHSAVNNATPSLRSLVDLNPSGTADLECVAFSNAFHWGNTTFTSVRCVRVGIAGAFTNISSNGALELRGFSVSPDTEQNSVAQLFSCNIVLGDCILDRITTLIGGLATGASKNILSQLFSLTSDDNTPKITNCLFARFDGRTAASDESVIFQNLPSETIIENVAAIGSRIEFTNSTNYTVINLRHADSLGTIQLSSVAVNAVAFTNSANMRFINFSNAGVAACRSELLTSDSQSYNIAFFNANYDGAGNCSGLGTSTGADVTFYNCTLANQRAGTSIWNSPTTFLCTGINVLNCRASTTGTIACDACQLANFDLIPCTASSFDTTLSATGSFAFVNGIDKGLTPTTGNIIIGPFGFYSGMTLTGDSQLDQNGGIEIPTSGDTVEIESLYVMHGVTSFQNVSPRYTYTESSTVNTDTTTAPSGLTIEFRVRNPSGDYGSYQTLNGTNLSASLSSLIDYDSDVGFYMQVKITATSTDSTRIFNQFYVATNIDNTFIAPDASITIAGAEPTDVTSMYLYSDDSLLYTFTGSGTFNFLAATYFQQNIYFIRRDVDGFEIMRTRSQPQKLLLGDNGVVSLYAGSQVQLAQSADVTIIKNIVTEYLDAAVSAIKTKTDNLPSDPATESSVQTAISKAKLAAALSA